MLIPLWFGFLHFSDGCCLTEGYDAAITFCWGRRAQAPLNELQWRLTWRFAWDWRRCRRDLIVIRSTRRSKVYVYLTGGKERANPSHLMYVTPAKDPKVIKQGASADWFDSSGNPRAFTVTFEFGKAEVEEQLGNYMIEAGIAQRTNIIRAGKSLLGSLANTIAGR